MLGVYSLHKLLYCCYMFRHYFRLHKGEILCPILKVACCVAINCPFYISYCRGADKSLALTRLKKKQLEGRHFSSDAEVIAAADSWLDGQPSEFFFEWLANVRVWSL